ncbi:MAG: gliding motility-associated C-terminal domain-containing protein [Bacteroidota bacterium]|nr:gliding motility-associated C-terminal domain-containing protein [Bacteroidota bacterium]
MKKRFYLFLITSFSLCNCLLFAQSYNDGPIDLQVKLREVQGSFAATDEALLGIGFAPDELSFKIWTKDNLNTYPWTGGACNQDLNFTPTTGGANSTDFNNTFASFSFSNSTVPQSLDLKIDAWEDDLPSDNLLGFCASGTVCTWQDIECCGVFLFGLCIGVETGDDYRCDADPFFQGLTYRSGPPCQWYSHGYINGSGCVNISSQPGAPNTDGYYKPRIETFWRYTKGTSFANAIDLGNLNPGTPLIHFNSNECYTDYYNASSGNDVIYAFNITNPTGVNISVCGANGAQYDSYLYLVYDTNATALATDDNFCGFQSELATPLCDIGTYYVVVDAVLPTELGTFTLTITEDINNAFLSNVSATSVSCNGGNDGQINTSLNGGVGPYTFSWYDINMNQIGNSITTNNNIDSLTGLSVGSYIYQIADFNNCIISDTVLIDEPNPISLSTSTTSTSCYGVADGSAGVSVLSGGTPPFSYSWNSVPIQNNPSAVFLSAGNYQVVAIDLNGCSDSTVITILEPPPVSVSINTTTSAICPGGSINLSAIGANSYSWSPANWLNTNIGSSVISTPASAISYVVTGTDINGCSNTDTISISLIQSISVAVNPPNPTGCLGEDIYVNLSAGPNVTYSWDPPSAVSVPGTPGSSFLLSPQNSTNYQVFVNYGVGCVDTISVPLTLLPVPSINVTSNPSICEGSSVALMATGTNNYTWFPSTGLNSTIGAVVTATPSVSTTYNVVGQDANGCKDTTTTTVSVSPNPVLSVFPSNPTMCMGDTSILYVSGANTYIWSPNIAISSTTVDTVSIFPVVNTTYNVLGIDSLGCSSIANIPVIVNPPPTVSSSATTSICLGGSVILTASGAVQYNWSPSSTLSSSIGSSVSATPTVNTTYLVTGIDANACSATSSTMVNVLPLPTLQISPTITTICDGESVTLTASGASTYLWSPALGLNTTSGTSVVATPNISTTYVVAGTDINNCSDIISTNITVNPLPNVSVQPAIASICEGSSVSVNAFGANNYTWSPSTGLNTSVGNTVVANPQSTIDYTINGTDVNNCTNTANLHVDVGVLPIISVSPISPKICEGSSITLSASGATNFSWTPSIGLSATSGGTVNASPLTTTTYNVVGADLNNCADSILITVNVNPLPRATITPNSGGTICSEDSALIIVQLSGNPPWDILHTINGTVQANINTMSNPLLIYANTDGDYDIVSVTDDNGCSNVGSGNANVQLLYTPFANFDFYPQTTTILDPTITFTNNSMLAYSWMWEFGDGFSNSTDFSPIHDYFDVGTYQVSLVVFNGVCSDTATAQIIIDPVFTLYIPDVFSPNGDRLNDEFIPIGEGISNYEIFIFNRWGDVIFNSTNLNQYWDGSINDSKIAPSGQYSYIINVVDDMQVSHTFKGHLLLQK